MNVDNRLTKEVANLEQQALRATDQIGHLLAEEIERESAPAWLRRRRRRIFEASAALCWVSFAFVTYLVRHLEPRSWDVSLARRLQAVRWPPAAIAMHKVSALGFAPVSHAIVLGASVLFALARMRVETLCVLATWGAGLLAGGVKLLIARPRPSENLVRVILKLEDYSYPSGHTVHYVTFYGFLFYLVYSMLRASPLRSALLGLLGSLVGLIGASRVYRGEHWPSDVFGAYSFGLGYLVALVEVHRRTREGESE